MLGLPAQPIYLPEFRCALMVFLSAFLRTSGRGAEDID